jgi:hypothetical protein
MNNYINIFNKQKIETIYIVFIGSDEVLKLFVSNAINNNIIILSINSPIITYCTINNVQKEKYIEAIQCYVYASNLYKKTNHMLLTMKLNVLGFPNFACDNQNSYIEHIINWITNNFTMSAFIINIIHNLKDNITTIYSNGYIKNIQILALSL